MPNIISRFWCCSLSCCREIQFWITPGKGYSETSPGIGLMVFKEYLSFSQPMSNTCFESLQTFWSDPQVSIIHLELWVRSIIFLLSTLCIVIYTETGFDKWFSISFIEDVDPTIGRFRNLISTEIIIPNKVRGLLLCLSLYVIQKTLDNTNLQRFYYIERLLAIH